MLLKAAAVFSLVIPAHRSGLSCCSKLLQIPYLVRCCTNLASCCSKLLQIPRLPRCCTGLLHDAARVYCYAVPSFQAAANSLSITMLHRSLIVLLKLAANSSSVTVLHRSGIVLLKAAANSICSLRCCTDLASCCSKLQLIPFVHCGAAQIWHRAAQSCSLFLLFIAVLHRSGIVLLKAAEKRLSQTGSVDGMVESLSAKNIPSLLPPPSTMVKVQIR